MARNLERLIERDFDSEKAIGIKELSLFIDSHKYDESTEYCIYGEIFSKKIEKDFWLEATFYDRDGDILGTEENEGYQGDTISSNWIKKDIFFDGYPFSISFWVENAVVSKIKLNVATEEDECEIEDSDDKSQDKEKESVVERAQSLLDELNKNEYIGGYENDNSLLDFCWIDDTSIYHKTCFQEMKKYGDVEMVADGLWKGQIPAKRIDDIFMLTSATSSLRRYATQKYKSDKKSEKEKLEFTINTPLFEHLEKHSIIAKLGFLLQYSESIGFAYYHDKTLYEAKNAYGQVANEASQNMKYKFYKYVANKDIKTNYMLPKEKMEVYRIALKYFPDAIFQYVPEWDKDVTGDKTWHWFDIYIPTENLAIGLTSRKSYESILKNSGEQTLKRRKFYEKQREGLCNKHGVKWCELSLEEKISDDNFLSILQQAKLR